MPVLPHMPFLVRDKNTKEISVLVGTSINPSVHQCFSHLGWTDVKAIKFTALQPNQRIVNVSSRNFWFIATDDTKVLLKNEKLKEIKKMRPRTQLINLPLPFEYGTEIGANNGGEIVCDECDTLCIFHKHFYHCDECGDYDRCSSCYDSEEPHEHIMTKLITATDSAYVNTFIPLECRRYIHHLRSLQWGKGQICVWTWVQAQIRLLIAQKAGIKLWVSRSNTPGYLYFPRNQFTYYREMKKLDVVISKKESRENMKLYPKFISYEYYKPFGEILYDPYNEPERLQMEENIEHRLNMYFVPSKEYLIDIETENGFYQVGIGNVIVKSGG